ncbi:hypothetical protein BTA51_09710 [Hahella sp. CCB-MM4]|uniref:ethylbenzene dehydrogenase-related protein n=1 Tax=Hahella sp. (strain CCB-MM4) TaxID=1926491 RepID=UPI000B9BF148|nr:ethylbenzene dehydrogenase-related protein [Hahella sp. CCB-MM4]OZG74038.1 hypothetical protein BTA51_09710 [Hahella sp. CCB-MM4]
MIFPASYWLRVLLHLCAVGLFTVSLASGLRLAVDGEWLLADLWARISPQGNVIAWHLAAGGGWVMLGITVLGALKKKPWKTQVRKSAGVIIRGIYLALPVQIAAGIWLYFGITGSGWVLTLHYWLAMVLSAVVLCHVVEQLIAKKGRHLPAVFIPTRLSRFSLRSLLLGVGALLSTGIAVVMLWWGSSAGYQNLYISPLDEHSRIQIDGAATESAWSSASAETVVTTQGNDYQRSVPVEVRALANAYTVYLLISWPDPEPNYSHLPLQKTQQGWRVNHNGFERDDERSFYEDKLAVMISKGNGFGGDHSIHLGSTPLAGYPASRSGRGLHYTEDGTIRDVWHWKAVRGADMSVLDDDYFGAPEAACAFCSRYKAGYQPDPVEDGGVRQNWDWFRPGQVMPLRLPVLQVRNQEVTNQEVTNQEVRNQEIGSDVPGHAMAWYSSIPYSLSLDNIPVGAQLPSVIWMSHYEGDRGDVRGQAQWHDGRWTLELARARDTGSPYDIALEDGVYMWVAPFDHAQTRHSYHHRPLRLRFAP